MLFHYVRLLMVRVFLEIKAGAYTPCEIHVRKNRVFHEDFSVQIVGGQLLTSMLLKQGILEQ